MNKEDRKDLVERLRERADSYRQSGPSAEHTAILLDESAAEIEGLRRELSDADEALPLAYTMGAEHSKGASSEELDRLRRELEEARRALEPLRSDRAYIIGHNDGWEAADEQRAWMQDKAWMDAVLMLVHYTEIAKRTWLVGHEEAAKQRDEWWKRCEALYNTKSAEDIAALSGAGEPSP